MLSTLDTADMATAIFILISFVEVPSLLKVALSYLKQSTSSSFCQFIMMLMGVFWLALLKNSLLFFELTSIL